MARTPVNKTILSLGLIGAWLALCAFVGVLFISGQIPLWAVAAVNLSVTVSGLWLGVLLWSLPSTDARRKLMGMLVICALWGMIVIAATAWFGLKYAPSI